MITNLFINGCSFLTTRPKAGVKTHTGIELAKLMDLQLISLAAGGRGNTRNYWTTRVWCEKFPEQAEKSFFLIGSTHGGRMDFPTNDDFKKEKFPTMETTFRTWKVTDRDAFPFTEWLVRQSLNIPEMMQIESIRHLLALQDYFTSKKYPFVFYNTLSDSAITNPDVQLMFDAIDKKRFFKYETSHHQYADSTGQVISKDDYHPTAEGHRDWANQLKEFIDANNLRTYE